MLMLFIIRFIVKRDFNDDSAADRIQELPSPYAGPGQAGLIRTTQKFAARIPGDHLPTGQNDLPECSARLDLAMDVAEVLRIDLWNHLGEGRANKLVID